MFLLDYIPIVFLNSKCIENVNIYFWLKAEVDYIRRNKLLFYQFLNCHQAVNIYSSS